MAVVAPILTVEEQPRHMSISISLVEVDCLLPNGLVVTVKQRPTAIVKDVKEEAFTEAKKLPFGNLLPDSDVCSITYIHETTGLSDLINENVRLCDLGYLQPVLRFEEIAGSREEKKMRQDLNRIIGFPLQEASNFLTPGLQSFRLSIFKLSYDVLQQRIATVTPGSDSELRYQYSPDYFPNPDVVQNARTELTADSRHSHRVYYHKADELSQSVHVVICVDEKPEPAIYHLMTPLSSHPRDVIELAIRHRCSKQQMSADKIDRIVEKFAPQYYLRLCGHNEFLITDCPLWQYRIVTELVLAGFPLTVELVVRSRVLASISPTTLSVPDFAQHPVQEETVSLWKLDFFLRFKVNSLTCVTFSLDAELRFFIAAQIFCFHDSISSICFSRPVEPTNLRWNDTLEFDLHSSDIPRASVVTLAICSMSAKQAAQLNSGQSGQTQHAVKNPTAYSSARPLAYANYPLFDFKSCLLQGKVSVYSNPIGRVDVHSSSHWSRAGGPTAFMLMFNSALQGQNEARTGPCVHLDFEVHRRRYVFPTFADYTALLNTEVYRQQLQREDKEKRNRIISDPTELNATISALSTEDLTQEERDLVWANRDNLLQHFPDSLPLLLSAIRWSNRLHVGVLYQLLRQWKQPSLELIMSLLASYVLDSELQQCLVDRLAQALKPDSLLTVHLLQVVQLLRLQIYPYNPIVQFVLRRACSNQRFANTFFWTCVSEMFTAPETDKFRSVLLLICEVIYRLSSGLRPIIRRQHDAISFLRQLVTEIKQQREEDLARVFATRIASQEAIEVLSGLVSPLHPSVRLGRLRPDNCRILKSAKLPVWLAWDVNDRFADPDALKYELIFKLGDDLRQDLLILQLLWLMDDCWLRAGIDTRIRPYSTMPVGRDIGFIEVITRAKTVMNIQRQSALGAIQVDSRLLLRWLREKNPGLEAYRLALANFTQSCAAYCVATFILGVGDRHPDNIMVCESGRLVHIDFGHFLDHRKKKFGISRERVPFVLTEDFINVISDGAEHGTKSAEFLRFQEACGQLYLLIRGATARLLAIFSLTVPARLPELKSIEDADYVRKTLCLASDSDDRRAAQYFQAAFSEAHGGQWSTKLDWFFHWVKHRRA